MATIMGAAIGTPDSRPARLAVMGSNPNRATAAMSIARMNPATSKRPAVPPCA